MNHLNPYSSILSAISVHLSTTIFSASLSNGLLKTGIFHFLCKFSTWRHFWKYALHWKKIYITSSTFLWNKLHQNPSTIDWDTNENIFAYIPYNERFLKTFINCKNTKISIFSLADNHDLWMLFSGADSNDTKLVNVQ